MDLCWNPKQLNRVFVLPAEIAEKHLILAGPLQLKVLLWFAAQNTQSFDAAACAAALRKSPAAIEEALQYWIEQQVLLPDGKAPVAAPQTAASEPTTPAPAPATTPATVLPVSRPQMKDVIRRQKESREFASLLQDVSVRLGRPITHGNMETLLYLYDTAGIPAAVILMVVGYAVSRGKGNMRYIEKVALGWADDGIVTLAAAEEHLLLMEQLDDAAERVQKLTGKARELTFQQRGMAHTWLYVWQLPEEMVRLALEQAAKTTKPLLPYANAILAGWHEDGITDPVAAAKTFEKKTAADKRRERRRDANEKSSLNLKDYETMLEDYVPTLTQKSKKE